MNERAQTEAEWATLAQRLQLDALHGALQSLEHCVSALESESARQSAELSRLDRKIAELRDRASLPRPSDQPRPDTQAQTGDNSVDNRQPSHHATTTVQDWPDLVPAGPQPPGPGSNWDEYTGSVQLYIDDRGVKVAPDPLAELVPAHLATKIRRRVDTVFRPAPWDRWDYGVVGLAVLVGALTDYLLVATPEGSFKGSPQRGSPLTAWMKEQSKKLAPMGKSDDLDRNALQRCIAKLSTAAESWAKVPYDLVSPRLGLTPNVHRLASLGHDPLLGLVLGVGDILSGTCTFIDKSGAWRGIDMPGHDRSSDPYGALVKVIVHGFSDVFTPQGLPPPFMAPFQLIGAKSGFTLKEGGDPVAVRDVTRYMYANGYDLRHFMTTKISPAIAEVILTVYHGVRACADRPENREPGIPERLKREQMLVLAHGLLASANILKTALYGWNPMAINLGQFQVLTNRAVSMVRLAAERDRLLRRTLDDGWEDLLSRAKRF